MPKLNPLFFLFQAEDGIRDLVRSRGLGDVYKRQLLGIIAGWIPPTSGSIAREGISGIQWVFQSPHGAVSYTHLTLPTSDLA